MRIGMSLRQSFVMTAAPTEERSRVAALSQLPVQGVSALAPTLTGYLFDEVSLAARWRSPARYSSSTRRCSTSSSRARIPHHSRRSAPANTQALEQTHATT